jgi:hypothetical protein
VLALVLRLNQELAAQRPVTQTRTNSSYLPATFAIFALGRAARKILLVIFKGFNMPHKFIQTILPLLSSLFIYWLSGHDFIRSPYLATSVAVGLLASFISFALISMKDD